MQNFPMPKEPDLPPLAADAPPSCDLSACGAPSAYSYIWEWGAHGVCCPEHVAVVQQMATNLSRKVTIVPLANAAPAPLLRDERVRLTAECMVVKEELSEAKQRGLDLYRENVRLTASVQSLTVVQRELKAQLVDAKALFEQSAAELAAKNAEHGELVDEIGRLRTLARFVDSPPPEYAEVDPESTTLRGGFDERG